MRRLTFGVALGVTVTLAPSAAQAQVPRQWISVSYDSLRTLPLHFKDHPVADLVGRPMAEAQREAHDYRSRDELTTVDVLEFRRRGSGAGITVYPFGLTTGAALGVRASVESLPTVRLAITGPADVPAYTLQNARAVDLSVGVFVSDRAPGWGLGSHAFVAGGLGRLNSELGGGSRYFGEGGGGLNVGPIGMQLAVKVAWNRLDEPVSHAFFTVPVTLRGTVSF
jgi:hypothetical protein